MVAVDDLIDFRVSDVIKSGKPVVREGKLQQPEVDTIIAAIGQGLETGCVCVETSRGKICSDPITMATSRSRWRWRRYISVNCLRRMR